MIRRLIAWWRRQNRPAPLPLDQRLSLALPDRPRPLTGLWDHCGHCRLTCDYPHTTPCPDCQRGSA